MGKETDRLLNYFYLARLSFGENLILEVNIFMEAQRVSCLLVVQCFVWPLMVIGDVAGFLVFTISVRVLIAQAKCKTFDWLTLWLRSDY